MAFYISYSQIPEFADLSREERKALIKKISNTEPYRSERLKRFVIAICCLILPTLIARDIYNNSALFQIISCLLAIPLILVYHSHEASKFRKELLKIGSTAP